MAGAEAEAVSWAEAAARMADRRVDTVAGSMTPPASRESMTVKASASFDPSWRRRAVTAQAEVAGGSLVSMLVPYPFGGGFFTEERRPDRQDWKAKRAAAGRRTWEAPRRIPTR